MFSRSKNQITITQEETTIPACCQRGVPVTLVMADPDDPIINQLKDAIRAHYYKGLFGLHLKITDRAVAYTAADADDTETDAFDEIDISYHAKNSKTKNAANGRQQSRQAKIAEVSNDIRKMTNKITKVIRTTVSLSPLDAQAVGSDIKKKPTKYDLRKNTEMRSNKRIYKTHQACPCICAKRNLAVHGCLCT